VFGGRGYYINIGVSIDSHGVLARAIDASTLSTVSASSPELRWLPNARMAHRYRWRDPQGRCTVKQIVQKEIPQWKDVLYPSQETIVVRVLDGEDILCCMTTGGGKSAMFAVPIVILWEMAQNPHLYPDLPVHALPIGLVITPTKGLAGNIVRSSSSLYHS
jgi:ATP-dependent helicase YprA (DUF1998 family)